MSDAVAINLDPGERKLYEHKVKSGVSSDYFRDREIPRERGFGPRQVLTLL